MHTTTIDIPAVTTSSPPRLVSRGLGIGLGLALLVSACGGGDGSLTATPAMHTVTTTVTGLRQSYNGALLGLNGSEYLRVYGDGSYTFTTPLADGTPYAVTVTTQPALPDQTCTVADGSGTIAGSDVANVVIDCPFPVARAVGGTVTGMTGSGLKLSYAGSNTSVQPGVLTIDADGTFAFPPAVTSAVDGTLYTVTIVAQPGNPIDACNLVNGQGTVAGADVASVQIVCGLHQVHMTLTGMRDTSVLTLTNNATDRVVMGAHTGPFTFPIALPRGSPYNVVISRQPTFPSQTCVVGNGSGTIGSSDVTVAIDCPYPTAYAVGGTIVGATGAVSVLYTADNLDFYLPKSFQNGAFAFTAAQVSPVAGTHYSVTVDSAPLGQRCDVVGGKGTVGASDVAGIRITCVPVSVASLCLPVSGAGTTHGSVSTAQTWTAAASPHIVPFDISIGAPLTIEACAVVRLAKGITVTVNPGGSMLAQGQLSLPVTFEASVAGQAWSSIRNLGGTLSLSHAVLTGGGDPLNTNPAYAGVLHMQSSNAGAVFHVDDVEIAGSLSQGVYINSSIGFDASSSDLRVHGSVGYPVHVYARVIGSLPSGAYTGNGHDAIAIAGSGGAVLDAQTLHNRGVPYHVGSGQDGSRMDVNSQVAGQVAVLTIDAGVTVQFSPGGILFVEPSSGTAPARGALIAIGGPAEADKIVFTSDQGAASKAGDWLGVAFGSAVDARSVMQNVRVEFAGGTSTTGSNSCPYPNSNGLNDAAIRIFGAPASQFITRSEIRSSLHNGFDRGWRADVQPDFLAGNTFTAVNACKQTVPRTFNGVCPLVLTCP